MEALHMINNPILPIQLKQALQSDSYQTDFPIGSLIGDFWVNPESGNIYTSPLRIVDYRQVRLPSGEEKLAAILLRVYATVRKKYEFHEHIQFYSKEYLNGIYYTGCSSDLRAAITPIQPGTRIESAKFFLPRLEDLHLNPFEQPDIDQLAWKYFQDTTTDYSEPCPKRAFTDPHGGEGSYLLRSDYDTWYLNSDGSAECFRGRGLFNLNFTPACAITA